MNYWDTEGKKWGKFELHTKEWSGAFWVLKHERIEPPKWAADAVQKYIEGVKDEEGLAKEDQARYEIAATGSGPNAHIARRQVEWWKNAGEALLRNRKVIMACRLWLADGEPSRYGEPPHERQMFVLDFVFANNSGEFDVPQGIEQPEGLYSELAEPFRFMNAQVTHDRLIGQERRELSSVEREQLISEVFPDAQQQQNSSMAEVVQPIIQNPAKKRMQVSISVAAKLCDVTPRTIINWENGKATPGDYVGRSSYIQLQAWATTWKNEKHFQSNIRKEIKNSIRYGDMDKLPVQRGNR